MRRTLLALCASALALTGLMSCGCDQPAPVVVDPAQSLDLVAQRTLLSACVSVNGKADARCTPGVTNPAVSQATIGTTICVPGWTERVRPPAAYTTPLKIYQMYLYGLHDDVDDPPSPILINQYKEDHLISLELGGATRAPLNLWPQNNDSARIKNNHSARLKIKVCTGQIQLADAQAELVTTWTQTPALP